MKKIIFLSMILISVLSLNVPEASAQVSLRNDNGVAQDTLTNADTSVLFTPVNGYKSTITLQVDMVRLSGTLAGTVTPVVSNDGITFYPIPVVNGGDSTITLTDASNFGVVFNMPLGYQYYGVKWISNGTVSGYWKATGLYRKQ